MSEKALRWCINIAGIICLYAFLAIRILPLFNSVLLEKYIPGYWENTKWGELYYFNFIKQFQEKNLPESSVKYRFTERHPALNDADILTFGDSFFDFARMTTFPEQLAQSLDKKVFYARMDLPLQYLALNAYEADGRRYMIYETAERFLHDRFNKPQVSDVVIDQRSPLRLAVAKVRDIIFLEDTELLLSQLLTRSYFTTHIYSAISTLKFNAFGHITNQTPGYAFDQERPWLFGSLEMSDRPGGFKHIYSEEEIENYCNNIRQLSDDLRDKYNVEMLFMIIPSKYTLYHTLLDDTSSSYDNFIPRMYAGLEKRNVPVIDFYDEMMAQRDDRLLYYGTDTHWTEEGLHIALNKTIIKLNFLNSEGCLANWNK